MDTQTTDPDSLFRMQSLDALFRHATEGIVITNRDGIIMKANPSSERLFGYDEGELTGKVIEDVIPERFRHSHSQVRKEYLVCPRARSMGKGLTLYGRRKNNSEFPVEVSLSFYKQGEEQFVIAFIIDVTERKKQEESIIRLNQELEKKVEERTKVLQEALIEIEKSKEHLTRSLEAEKELNDMKSRFVTMASHEFRTPLSTILSSVSLVQKYNKGENDDKISRHVGRIKSAVTNMTLILNDFLSAEKLEEGKVLMRPEHINVQDIASEVLGEMQGLVKAGQKVDHRHEGSVTAHGDRQMIRNIFLNLLSNAIKFSPEHKIITFRTQVTDEKIRIVVADQGIGIPAEEQEHLFERFFRARNVTNIQGTGLGLNIVSKYLESMKGTIEFSSELGKGTTFYITIPQIKNENDTDH